MLVVFRAVKLERLESGDKQLLPLVFSQIETKIYVRKKQPPKPKANPKQFKRISSFPVRAPTNNYPKMKRSCGRRLEKSKICGYPEYVGTENHEGPMPSNPSASDILTAQAQCICERESSAFFCTACGGFFYGRVAQKCTQHPNVSCTKDNARIW